MTPKKTASGRFFRLHGFRMQVLELFGSLGVRGVTESVRFDLCSDPLQRYSGPMASRRHLARIAVMQTVFEMQMREIDPDQALKHNVAQHGGDDAVDSKFCGILLKGILENGDAIRDAIQKNAPQWPLERMDTITRCILMIGGYELLFAKDAPPAVVMNEAIEVAKEFGTEEGAKFVNGVLNALAHGAGASQPAQTA